MSLDNFLTLMVALSGLNCGFWIGRIYEQGKGS